MTLILKASDDEHSADVTLEEVQRLIGEGYTSGIDLTWDLVEDGS